ncbi:MAG: 2-oxoglutarate oxidoreductase [Clostridiales bacterium]|jgi:2-oxoglutarate ferredoxin oxidoreductase subunit beta|nr:2-oxoglutarate oxidoreductase [Clostridiales bacterium]
MEKIYSRPAGLKKMINGYCPGCLHSAAGKLIMSVLEELDLLEKTVMVDGVGCCASNHSYIDIDACGSPHGRPGAVASAIKRCSPETIVVTYQGDGDLASIGLAETMMAANRGDNISVFFINNANYGMTGGQMAPTTLMDMKTSTTPYGRHADEHGYPMHMCEVLNTLTAPSYIARVTCIDAPNMRKARAAVKQAIQHQLDGKGFSMVEFVSNCPTNWGVSPLESLKFIKEKMLPEFPLGEFRNR